MKKYFILISAAVLALSCAKELVDNQEVSGKDLKTITFESVMTKTTVTDEGAVAWEKGDEISIYYLDAQGKAATAVATATSAGKAVTFTAQIPEEDNPTEYYAAYPKGTGVMDPSTGKFYLNIKNSVCDGTFKSANFSASYTSAEAMSLQFHNAVGMIRLAVPEGGKFTKDGVEYTLTGVYLRGQVKAFSDKNNNGPVEFNAVDATFGEPVDLTVGETGYGDGDANINMPNLSSEALASGYVYIPSLPGTWPTGLCIRYIANFEDVKKGSLPAVLSQATPVEIVRGEVLKLSDQTAKVHMNYYVSSTGEGNGLTEATPMSFAKMQEMLDLTDDGYFGAYTLQRVTFNILEGNHSLTSTITIPTASTTYSATIKGAGATKTILDGQSEVGVLFIGDNTHICLSDLTITKGRAANGGGIRLDLSSSTTDKSFILDCSNCIFTSNEATDFGGALFVNTGARGGLARFNNCSFIGNTAKSHSYILGTANGTTAFMFNNCLLKKTTQKAATETAGNGILIYMNNANARLAMNNCTVNAHNGEYNNGGAITNKGYTLIANTTIWSSQQFGKWGTVTLGAANSETGSKIINSFVKNGTASATTYQAFYLRDNYYQNIKHCFYTKLSGTSKGGVVANNVDVTGKLTYDSSANKSKVINGVTLECYILDWEKNATAFEGFECTDLKTVKSEMETTDIIGEPFVNWLETIPNSLSHDIFGNPRNPDSTCPGSIVFTNTPAGV